MPLEPAIADWVEDFMAGKITVVRAAANPAPSEAEAEKERNAKTLRWQMERERTEERKKKNALLKITTQKIEAIEQQLKTVSGFSVERKTKSGKKIKEETQGPIQHKTLDTGAPTGDIKSFKFGDETLGANEPKLRKRLEELRKKIDELNAEADTLAKMITQRSLRLKPNQRGGAPEFETETVRLFTDQELAREIYTPLVRSQILGDTFVRNKFSETQEMLDGSDKYYLAECREKGRAADSGKLGLVKAGINVGSQVASTVFGAMGAPKIDSKTGLTKTVDISQGHDWSKDQVARFNAVSSGINAVLGGGIDLYQAAQDASEQGSFDEAKFTKLVKGIGVGIGDLVGGVTGNASLGGIVGTSIGGAASLGELSGALGKQIESGKFDLAPLLKFAGEAVAAGFTIKGDATSDTQTAVAWANMSSEVTAAFNTALALKSNNILAALRSGNYKVIVNFFIEAGAEAGKMLGAVKVTNPAAGAATDSSNTSFTNTSGASDSQKKVDTGIDKGADGLKALSERFVGKGKGWNLPGATLTKAQEAEFAKLKKELAEHKKAQEQDLVEEGEAIRKALDAEMEAFTQSLTCLGSSKPNEAEFKSIAKLIEKLESDRKLFEGIVGIFGGGVGAANGLSGAVATTVANNLVPVLKASGQLAKFLTNVTAAVKRATQYRDWCKSQQDAMSAVSPYYTSIRNFQKNTGGQTINYWIQAGANVIQAGLAFGEMSPLKPILSVAGGAVGAAAATTDAIFKYAQKRKLAEAWSLTKEAMRPENKNNRKLRLLAREINPTLAKYSIAYGALIQKDAVAITAMDRCGLDRETLTRTGDGVKEVKKYLETVFRDDGSVYVTPDVETAGVEVSEPELKAMTWALSYGLWVETAKLDTPDSPIISAGLLQLPARKQSLAQAEAKVEEMEAQVEAAANAAVVDARDTEQKTVILKRRLGELLTALESVIEVCEALQNAFVNFEPAGRGENRAYVAIRAAVLQYAELAGLELVRCNRRHAAASDAIAELAV